MWRIAFSFLIRYWLLVVGYWLLVGYYLSPLKSQKSILHPLPAPYSPAPYSPAPCSLLPIPHFQHLTITVPSFPKSALARYNGAHPDCRD